MTKILTDDASYVDLSSIGQTDKVSTINHSFVELRSVTANIINEYGSSEVSTDFVNNPVVENPIENQDATTNTEFTLDVSSVFTDVDTYDELTLTATLEDGSALPTWLTFDGTGFSGTPSSSDDDDLSVKVIATDTKGRYTYDTFDLNIIYAVESLTLSDSTLTFETSDATTLTATILPANADNQDVNWASDNESIATVDSTGGVTPVDNGTCTITASSDYEATVNDTCDITVDFKVTSIGLNAGSQEFADTTSTFQLEATILPINANDNTIDWDSTDDLVATVDGTGLISSVGVGNCVIVATAHDGGGADATCEVTVTLE